MQMMHISHVNSKIGLVTMQPKLYYATNLIYHSSAWQFFRLLAHASGQFFPSCTEAIFSTMWKVDKWKISICKWGDFVNDFLDPHPFSYYIPRI